MGKDDFMQAIKAVYDGVKFTPKQPIPVQGHYDVVITFVSPISQADTQQEKKLPRSTAKGLLKGKVRMSADFNEPLEDMKEYMP
jgi:hypothetical protein